MTIDSVRIEHECAKLIIRYAALNDAGRWDEVAAMYIEDGRMNRPTAPDDFVEGREAILASFLARPARAAKHVCCNIVVTVQDADHATATSTILLFTGENADDGGLPFQSAKPPLVGSYDDRLVRTADGWRFAERRGRLDFRPAR